MADIVAELADRGRALAPEDRSRLVELLLESLHEPPLSDIAAGWDAEIVRRVVQRACFKAQFVEFSPFDGRNPAHLGWRSWSWSWFRSS